MPNRKLGVGLLIIAGLAISSWYVIGVPDSTSGTTRNGIDDHLPPFSQEFANPSVEAPLDSEIGNGQSARQPIRNDVEIREPSSSGSNSPSPSQIYLAHIQRASAGVARSQYRVAQAIQSCRTAFQTDEAITTAANTGIFTPIQLELVRRQHNGCKELFPLVSDMDSEYVQWLRRAGEGGDALAKSMDALLSYPNFDPDELRTLIGEALRTGEPEAYYHAVMFFANVDSASADAPATHAAWLLISCEYSQECNPAQQREQIRQSHRQAEYQRILTIESKIRNGLRNGQWSEIGF